jgi:type VI secretion system protein VasJ
VSDPSSALSAIGAAVKFLRDKDMTDPRAYAVIRAVRWSTVGLPPEETRRQLEPPETELVKTLTGQLADQAWERLLKNAEAAFRSNDPLWLDLQRYACAAMKALGANYDKARQAVIGATAGLVKRLGDGLFDLQFRGGMALCSGETKLWVQSEVAPPQRAGGGGGESNAKLTEAWEKAQQLAGSGQVQEAMELLQAGLDGSGQRRDRYLWRLRMAELCCDASRFAMAASLVELCCQESGRFCIDEWEPRLAAEAAGVLYRARRALMLVDKQPEPAMVQAVRESYAKLCQLDPMAALSAEPPGK